EKVQGFSEMSDERARDECRKWRVEQLDRRAKIVQRFTRTIAVPLRVGGRAFEGLLPVSELPPVADPTVTGFEISVDLPAARPSRSRALAPLDPPLHAAPEGSLTARLLRDPLQDKERTVAVCDPSHPGRIHYFFNEAQVFYQSRPTTPSPDELDVDLEKRR